MFEDLLPSLPEEAPLPYDLLVEKTEGFSGSDIRLLCKEAAMQPLRRLMAELDKREELVPEDGILYFYPLLCWVERGNNYMSGNRVSVFLVFSCSKCNCVYAY